jgi:hypothetical protein
MELMPSVLSEINTDYTRGMETWCSLCTHQNALANGGETAGNWKQHSVIVFFP